MLINFFHKRKLNLEIEIEILCDKIILFVKYYIIFKTMIFFNGKHKFLIKYESFF